MRKNCGRPAIAAVAHGTTRSPNFFRNRNGNSANTAKKIKYHVSGRFGDMLGFAASNRLKCQAHSSAATQARPTAGSQSCENIFATPSNNTIRSRARPKTGDGFASCSRNVAMMSSRNGQHGRARRQERGQVFRLQGILIERDGFGEQARVSVCARPRR